MRRMWLGVALAGALAVLGGSVALVAVQRTAGPAAAGSYPGAATGPMRGAGTMMGRAGTAGGMMGSGTAVGGGMMGPGTGVGGGMMGPGTGVGGGMMGSGADGMGGVWAAGSATPVTSIAQARERATTAGAPAGLHPGEVIWFDNGFYVQLRDAANNPATEVLVDPATGAVRTEPGPAMMWNTRFGMPAARGAAATVSPQRARELAGSWLATAMPSLRADDPDTFPGYYTIDAVTADGTVGGMLSVNATTGAVWYHTWHGRFIARDDS